MRINFVAVASCLLAGCESAPEVPASLRSEAKVWAENEVGSPLPLRFGDVWKVGGHEDGEMLCGQFTGLPGMSDVPVRYVYIGESHSGVVEPHQGWIGLDTLGSALLAQTRQVFDETWAKYCSRYRPGWF